MKKQFQLFFIACTFALASCNNQQPEAEAVLPAPPPNPKEEFAKLNTFLQRHEEPSQKFTASTAKKIKVTGAQGTTISINPTDLETESGQPVAGDVEIELKELSTRQQLVRTNAQTVSDGQILVTGGAYYINMTSAGQQLKLKEGKTYAVEFPQLADEGMSLYFGQRDSLGSMNWNPANRNIEPKPETPKPGLRAILTRDKSRYKDTDFVSLQDTTAEGYRHDGNADRISNKVYKALALNQLGWMNCDRLFPPSAARTNVQFTIANPPEEVNYVKVNLVFSDIKSVMESYYYVYRDTVDKDDFKNIPAGQNVRFFAVAHRGDKIFAALTDVKKVTANASEKLLLKEMSEADFDGLLKSIE